MQKNVTGQKIGAQLVSATDGSAFTGSVTCYVCGDAGSQAAGSVGSGACTHEGNGYHTYAPAQAETNYDLIAFTFTGTGAVPATVQVFTAPLQTGDSYARIGAAGAGLTGIPWNAAWDAEVQSECQDAITASDLATAAALDAVDNFVDTEIGALTTELAKVPKSDSNVTFNATALASINAEVVDALNTDTYAEPGQGVPAATASLVAKIGYLYKSWRNKKTQTSSEWALYADDGTTKDHEAVVSDDGTTTTKGEIGTGA